MSNSSSVAIAAENAHEAFSTFSRVAAVKRAELLEAIATELETLGDSLIETASRESNLPIARITGERGRTCAQLRMFATGLRAGEYLDVRIETADPERKPLPKPDLRRMKFGIGPVAVFGASNFPLAFSVPGGDTASALAAGCPVVAKAHPAHPETSRMCAEAISRAVAKVGLPEGVFSLVEGGVEVGQALVSAEPIAAVGFTGSKGAGMALYELAGRRSRPIPVFAEMGSVNPVFVLPEAIAARGEAMAKGYAGSLTLGVGQFCTNPGLILGVGEEFSRWVESVGTELASVAPGTMLTEGIQGAFASGLEARCNHAALETVARTEGGAIHRTSGADFLAHPELAEELFGPAAIAVVCADEAEMLACARAMEGQLTATLQLVDPSSKTAGELVAILQERAGRLLVNGWPTGVEVNSAMQHGGPFPATTDSRFTSVGTAAIERWLRPVAFQDFPEELLPAELKGERV